MAKKPKKPLKKIAVKHKKPFSKKPSLKKTAGKAGRLSGKEPISRKRRSKELTALIALGKEKGRLTFEEVNNILPVDVVSSEEIDEILSVLGGENIKIVDTEDEDLKGPATDAT